MESGVFAVVDLDATVVVVRDYWVDVLQLAVLHAVTVLTIVDAGIVAAHWM